MSHRKQAPTSNDSARIASVSKAYNGAITLALVSQGSLSLTDTVGGILPTLPRAWAMVTVAQLLQHTSGMPDYIKDPTFLKELQANPQQVLTPTQLLGFVANEPLLFTPGSKYDYSDSDNIILGLMDEAASKGTYEAALEHFVTTPLGLSADHAAFELGSEHPLSPRLRRHRGRGARRREHVLESRSGLGVGWDALDTHAN